MGTKARNGGQQLEVTVIISGDHRKFNIPNVGGANSSKPYLASPAVSSSGGSSRLDISGGSSRLDISGGSSRLDISGGSSRLDISGSSREDFEQGSEAKGDMEQRLPMAKDTFFYPARRKGQKEEQRTGGGSEFASNLPPNSPSDLEFSDRKSRVDLVSGNNYLLNRGYILM